MGGALRVALLGCGTVGSEVARLLTTHADDLAARVGRPLELAGIAVRRIARDRGDLPVDASLFTTDAAALATRDDVDIVVEVIGGIEPARSLILAALEAGASVVTANKALLAEDGATLFDAADKHGGDLYYEAAVAGAIPLLRPLRESLAGDRVRRVLGIVNGTTNYILTRMTESGASFSDALEEAQALGLRRGRPDRRRRGLRRRRQGRDPRRARVPHPGHRGRRPPRGHHRGHRRRRRQRPRHGLRRQAARDRRGVRGRQQRRRPGAPRDDPRRPPAGVGARGLQRGLRRVRGRRRADVLRPRRRRLPDRQRGARRHRRRRAAQGLRRPRPGGVGVRRPAAASHGRDRDPLPRQPRRGRPVRRPRAGRDRVRRARGLDRDRAAGEARRGRRGAGHRHPPRHRCRAVRRPSTRCAGSTSCAGCSA